MNPVYPDSVRIYAKLSGVWSDISSDVISEFTGNWGINNNSPISRLADTGYMKFQLNNTSGKYTPNTPNSLNGWGKGTEVKLVITFESEEYIKFYGKVSEIDIDSGSFGKRLARVSVVDWLDYANKYPLSTLAIETNKAGDYAVEKIIQGLPIQPKSKIFDADGTVFPTIFDSTAFKTRAYTELNKIALSELGYIYLTKDRDNGERLIFESANHRNGLRELSIIPKGRNSSAKILAEDGSFILTESGEKIIANETTQFAFNNNMERIDVVYGENVLNQVRIRAYPKKIDTSLKVLFSLDTKMLVPSSQTIKFTGTFTDGVNEINGTGLVNPVATTDYVVNTKADGTGTDITSYVQVAAVYSSNSVEFSIYNTYNAHGYIQKLQVRGYGIYLSNPIEMIEESTNSIENYGYETITLDQKYQVTVDNGVVASKTFLENYKDPKSNLDKIHLIANASEDMMYSFLALDVGSKVYINETQTGIDGYFYIQSVDFIVSLGGVIKYSWNVTESFSLEKGLVPVELHFGFGTQQGINFGYLPKLSNLSKRTYTMWIKMDDWDSGSVPRHGIGIDSDYAGTILFPTNAGKMRVYTRNENWPGRWETNEQCWTPGEWAFVAMTRDTTNDPFVDPIIYASGVAKTLTEQYSPLGTIRDETGSLFVLGNSKTATVDFTNPMGGWIKDARVYNRVLSPEEIYALYLGEEVTDGLVFQSPVIKEKDSSLYDNQSLTSEMKILENIYGYVGTPNDNPSCIVGG